MVHCYFSCRTYSFLIYGSLYELCLAEVLAPTQQRLGIMQLHGATASLSFPTKLISRPAATDYEHIEQSFLTAENERLTPVLPYFNGITGKSDWSFAASFAGRKGSGDIVIP